MLADRQQVGEQLARVEVVAERVDDRNRGAERHLLEPRLRVGAPDDRGHLAFENARGVGRRLLAAQLAVRGRDDQRAAAEVGDPHREAHARAGRRLVEDDRDGLRAGERLGAEAVLLQLLGQLEDLELLGSGQVVVAQKVPGHATASKALVNFSVNSSISASPDDERRRDSDAVLARRVDDEAERERRRRRRRARPAWSARRRSAARRRGSRRPAASSRRRSPSGCAIP